MSHGGLSFTYSVSACDSPQNLHVWSVAAAGSSDDVRRRKNPTSLYTSTQVKKRRPHQLSSTTRARRRKDAFKDSSEGFKVSLCLSSCVVKVKLRRKQLRLSVTRSHTDTFIVSLSFNVAETFVFVAR